MWSAILALLSSRKFVVTLAAVLVAAPVLSANEFARAVTQLAAVLTIGIAIEDHGRNRATFAVRPPPEPKEPKAIAKVIPFGVTRG